MTSSPTKLILLIALLLSVCICIEVQPIGDHNIDATVGDGKGANWLLLFYLETCPHCKMAKESLDVICNDEQLVGNETPVKDLHFGKIECSINNWSCMRFNITRVPYIVMLQNDKMFEFASYPTKQALFNFIVDEKTVESGLEIPPPFGMMGVVSKVFEESVRMLNEQIQEYITNTLKLDLKWNSYYTILLLINGLFLLLIVEYWLISLCCTPKKHPTKKTVVADKKIDAPAEEPVNENKPVENSEDNKEKVE